MQKKIKLNIISFYNIQDTVIWEMHILSSTTIDVLMF